MQAKRSALTTQGVKKGQENAVGLGGLKGENGPREKKKTSRRKEMRGEGSKPSKK